ncbi:restriction endonuclease [Bacillus alkalicellulosilyticus]|uniref:restriction endonuclease n=1 Tax=Alkalihalobacterium alkalicellulosilyticum TaxID=1912214 RepID=UPI001482E618|nr:restriction endonuclease [Bacillus alkalicellulosilyticus]
MPRKRRRNRKKKNDYSNVATIAFGILLFITTYPDEPLSITIIVLLFLSPIAFIIYKFGLPRLGIFNLSGRHRLEIHNVDKLNGHDFEHFLAPLFRKKGYSVKVTRGSGDFGADLVLRNVKGQVTVVQAKRYSSNIGVSAVQEIVAAKPMYKATNAIVITNQYFTPAAVKLAKANGVKLLDRNKLIDMIKHANETSRSVLLFQRLLAILRLRAE